MSDSTIVPRGPRIVEKAERMWRQVTPAFVDNGRPSSQVFRPGKSDYNLLSVSHGSRISAGDAYKLHTGPKGLKSVGVWYVTVQECETEQLSCYHDPDPGPPPDDAHCVVDFQGLGRGQQEAKSKRLLARALEHGCVYAPTQENQSRPSLTESTSLSAGTSVVAK